ncbi:hypothetical protein ACG7TL_001129 [Trametes sanguinea]
MSPPVRKSPPSSSPAADSSTSVEPPNTARTHRAPDVARLHGRRAHRPPAHTAYETVVLETTPSEGIHEEHESCVGRGARRIYPLCVDSDRARAAVFGLPMG